MDPIGTVADILKTKGNAVWSIAPDASVFQALQIMAEKNVGALLVMEQDRLVGLVSERDYARKIVLLGRNSNETPVREIISARLVTVGPEATVPECLRLMTGNRIRHLPVLDERGVTGVISIGDLVNWIMNMQRIKIDQLQKYISGEYAA